MRWRAVLAPQVAALAAGYTHVLGPSTTFGKDLLPRVAALLGVAAGQRHHGRRERDTFKRPIYAGNAIVTVEVPADSSSSPRCARPRSRPPAAAAQAAHDRGPLARAPRCRRIRASSSCRGRARGPPGPADRSARRRPGGRALGSAENFKIIYALADKLGAAVGASRAAVDAGYVPNDLQVGQTGKIIAPELYVAIGISGAIQHLTGIKDARTIVAINKDAEAPIFEIADFGLVGDWTQAVPELIAALRSG